MVVSIGDHRVIGVIAEIVQGFRFPDRLAWRRGRSPTVVEVFFHRPHVVGLTARVWMLLVISVGFVVATPLTPVELFDLTQRLAPF
jgi:hypothetical protein